MLKILFRRYVHLKKILIVLILFMVNHYSGMLFLENDYLTSVLDFYSLGYHTFYTIINFLLPYAIFFFLFIFCINPTDDYFLLIIQRKKHQFAHIVPLILYLIILSIIYWGLYMFTFNLAISPSISFALLIQISIQKILVVLLFASIYFCLNRVLDHTNSATIATIILLASLALLPSPIAHAITQSCYTLMIILCNLAIIGVSISKKGVSHP